MGPGTGASLNFKQKTSRNSVICSTWVVGLTLSTPSYYVNWTSTSDLLLLLRRVGLGALATLAHYTTQSHCDWQAGPQPQLWYTKEVDTKSVHCGHTSIYTLYIMLTDWMVVQWICNWIKQPQFKVCPFSRPNPTLKRCTADSKSFQQQQQNNSEEKSSTVRPH